MPPVTVLVIVIDPGEQVVDGVATALENIMLLTFTTTGGAVVEEPPPALVQVTVQV